MMKNYTYLCLLYAVTIVEMEIPLLKTQGYVGQNLTFECTGWDVRTSTDSNSKYFCHDPCSKNRHIIVKVQKGETKRVDSIELQNKGAKGLSVTFINLQKSDSKIYICGLDRFGYDSFIKVKVEVLDVPPSAPTTTSETTPFATTSCTTNSLSSVPRAVSTVVTENHNTTVAPTTEESGIVPYLIAGTVLIVILMILLVIAKKMKKQITFVPSDGGPEAEPEQNTVYDEIRDHQTVSQHAVVSSVYALVTHSDKNSEDVYANAHHHQSMQEDIQNKNHSKATADIHEVSLVGLHTDTLPQTDLEYSLLQLPR